MGTAGLKPSTDLLRPPTSKLFQRRRAGRLAGVLLWTLLLPGPARAEVAAAPSEIVERMNAARAAQGRRPLVLHPALAAVAEARARMSQRPRPRPETAAPADREAARRGGYEAQTFSELFVQAAGDADDVLAAASDYEEFVDEVLREDARDVGIGVSAGDDPPLYVFVFARSMAEVFGEKTAALSDLAGVRAAILARVNRERAARRLLPLRSEPILDGAAERHARDMIARSYYAHESPEGSTVIERSKALGYRPRFAGENIARGQYSVEEVMDGWMSSPPHRAHILAANFTETGSAVAVGRNANGYEVIWVQCFGRPREGVPVVPLPLRH